MTAHRDIDFRAFARQVAQVVEYEPGQLIFQEGDPPHFMYFVLSGCVEISSHGKLIETVDEGNALGIVSLIDNQPRATRAKARTMTELAVMDRRKFRYMVEEVPNFVWYVMNHLTHRLRAVNAAL